MMHQSSALLAVVRDSLLLVDREQFLFANKAFEDLCNTTSHAIRQSSSLIMSAGERNSFFDRVRGLMDGHPLRNEALVECTGTQTGPFLSRVSFHVYFDETDGNNKCACNFVDPMFYRNLFTVANVSVALLEYLDDEGDCRVFRSNRCAVDRLGFPECATIDGLSLKRDLGFELEQATRSFFRACRQGDPHLKPVLISKPRGDSQLKLMAAFAFIGYNIRNLPVFTLVANHITDLSLEREQLETCKQVVASQRTFFAKVMHELRAPVSGLMGMASLLRHTALTFEQEDFVKTIEVCGHTLLSYTDTVLDLTNIEHNNLVLSLAPFNVEQCIEEALSMVSPMACLRKAELLYEIETPIPPPLLIGDMLRVRQVLLALLSNAIKFTTREGAHVIVRAVVTEEDGLGFVSFAVMDEGIGISCSQQTRLFTAFTQADRSVGQIFGGTGLGLAISKSVVGLMGGTLTLQSEQGRGSTFTFTLPIELALDECNAASTSAVFKGKSVLIVVADAPLAMNLQNRLRAFKLNIFWSPNDDCDEEATKDVVLTDMEGLARRRGELSLPTILVSWARPVRFSGNFLRKPVSNRQLHKAVHKAFGLSESSLEVQGPSANVSPRSTGWKATCRVHRQR